MVARSRANFQRRHCVARSQIDNVFPIQGASRGLSVEGIAAALRNGEELPDHWFDRFLPHDLKAVSHQHWTPLAVTARVAEWILAVRRSRSET